MIWFCIVFFSLQRLKRAQTILSLLKKKKKPSGIFLIAILHPSMVVMITTQVLTRIQIRLLAANHQYKNKSENYLIIYSQAEGQIQQMNILLSLINTVLLYSEAQGFTPVCVCFQS